MLEQCKMKNEDFEKFKKDKLHAEVLEKKKLISRTTIRSKAAKAIEKFSRKSFIRKIFCRKVPEGGLPVTEAHARAVSELSAILGRKVSRYLLIILLREAAILVIGVISGF